MFFLWIDCEMTGLDCAEDHILEIACILTDNNMNKLAEFQSVIYHNNNVLNSMNDWCQEIHKKSGLIELVKNSRQDYLQVEAHIMAILSQYAKKKETYLAGNSVYNDLNFIKKYMPKIVDFIHYRLFDVSTFKILALKKNIPLYIKKNNHTALDDIKESILEYAYFERKLFIQ